jgi:DNA-binding XRE family transcriptional regulator
LDYWYRKRMSKVYTQRALAQLAGIEPATLSSA